MEPVAIGVVGADRLRGAAGPMSSCAAPTSSASTRVRDRCRPRRYLGPTSSTGCALALQIQDTRAADRELVRARTECQI